MPSLRGLIEMDPRGGLHMILQTRAISKLRASLVDARSTRSEEHWNEPGHGYSWLLNSDLHNSEL